MSEMTIEGLADLQRCLRDALDLAIAGNAPMTLLDKLGAASGLVEALAELPRHALIPAVVGRAHRALSAWHEWQRHGLRMVAA
jgi:hypothetical protein